MMMKMMKMMMMMLMMMLMVVMIIKYKEERQGNALNISTQIAHY